MAVPAPGVSWRINAERAALLGWSRAILMQLAHPLIAAGVDEHSSFRAGPVAAASRLHGTVRAMLSLTFGDDAARERTVERIRAIHRRVNGRLREAAGRFPAGTPYSAEDPDLLLWVHATLLDSILLVHQRVVVPLPEADCDAYCEEAAPIAVSLGACPAEVPRTRASLRAYVDGMLASDRIAVSAQARALGRTVLAPPLGRAIWPVSWANRVVAIGLLPPRLQEQYGFPWTPAARRHVDRVLHALAAARRQAPAAIAHWPEARRHS
jgi:uncharacterized protein (DUF2236 family)